MRRICRVLSVIALVTLAALQLSAQDLQELARRITEFSLPNGLHFIVVERREAPVVSFTTFVKAGSVDDPAGETGLAAMFQRLAYKGTETIGTKDWAAEKKALDAVEEAYDRLEAERNKGLKKDAGKIGAAEMLLNRAISQAHAIGKPAEFSRIIEENGGVGLSAIVKSDSAEYSYSLPSNRIELWFLLESQRLLRPAFRDFYKERDAVLEQYRDTLQSNLQGKLTQALLESAFSAHPYRNPAIGWPSDLANLRKAQAREFFDRYYVPANITIGIAGDVDPLEARRLADRYFGPMPARPLPPRVYREEPPQSGPKTIVVEAPVQLGLVAYKRPDQYDRDDLAFDLIQFILSDGRTGWLIKDLVLEKRIAVSAQAVATFPGGRYPGLFAIMFAPSSGHTIDENRSAIDDILTRLMNERVDAATMARVKAKLRVVALQRLGENMSLVSLLTTYHAAFGDWRKMLTGLDDIQKVTADDIQRTARKYFTPVSRTTVSTTASPRTVVAPAPATAPRYPSAAPPKSAAPSRTPAVPSRKPVASPRKGIRK